jgi:hypothetical protein
MLRLRPGLYARADPVSLSGVVSGKPPPVKGRGDRPPSRITSPRARSRGSRPPLPERAGDRVGPGAFFGQTSSSRYRRKSLPRAGDCPAAQARISARQTEQRLARCSAWIWARARSASSPRATVRRNSRATWMSLRGSVPGCQDAPLRRSYPQPASLWQPDFSTEKKAPGGSITEPAGAGPEPIRSAPSQAPDPRYPWNRGRPRPPPLSLFRPRRTSTTSNSSPRKNFATAP